MTEKENILRLIRETAVENGGVPLGTGRFASITGIGQRTWNKHWVQFSDAVKEAGFQPNKLNSAISEEVIAVQLIGLIRRLGKIPSTNELTFEKRNDDAFIGYDALRRRKISTQPTIAKFVLDYCQSRPEFDDVVAICESAIKHLQTQTEDEDDETAKEEITIGEVYLFKSGRYYKIGKSKDAVRRANEIRVQMPEDLEPVWTIKTDDPTGIEAYWHRRFESKRMNGEWFDLKSADIKSFKRWRTIV